MRTPIHAKNAELSKKNIKGEGGLLIRLPIKKIYCVNCHKLVKGQIQNTGSDSQLNCPKCDKKLRVWNGSSWKSVGDEEQVVLKRFVK